MQRKANETHLVLILVDHRAVDVSVARTDRRLDLIARQSTPITWFSLQTLIGLSRTAFSTSFGFESQVPRPIWGISWPLESLTVFPKDMASGNKGEGDAETSGENGGKGVSVDITG